MKKILFPIVAALFIVSCSSDETSVYVPTIPTPSTNTLKATINGTEYTFDTFQVDTQTHTTPDHTYVDLEVRATISTDATKEISFSLEQDVPGTETIYFFYLMNGDEEFDTDHTGAAFTHNVTTNANKHIVGTFSGALARFDNSSTAEITNGSFDIKY
ncbi:hypothetical protein [Flavobacterium caeni]|uniref:Lipoprotein n=1 Tax=Flavobacterium caeni TaxID=490189 RepID=A0A1G5ITC7_9FLAO|nr:hypothetical protein [Flavobacterium caeni]SCY79306.1 hypothetical protein SAMN02927903_02382 [Flavobacterium caeni]